MATGPNQTELLQARALLQRRLQITCDRHQRAAIERAIEECETSLETAGPAAPTAPASP